MYSPLIFILIILTSKLISGQGPPPKNGIKIPENEENKEDDIENIGKKILNAAAKKLSTINTEDIEKKITKALGLESNEEN
uniref:Uncharacterized protein n=1 Tax=Meloidogyne floridensis TaxID=298350 RepID=A0A915P8R2_9BILA